MSRKRGREQGARDEKSQSVLSLVCSAVGVTSELPLHREGLQPATTMPSQWALLAVRSLLIMHRRVRLCIRIYVVCRFYECVREEKQQDAKNDADHRRTTVLIATIQSMHAAPLSPHRCGYRLPRTQIPRWAKFQMLSGRDEVGMVRSARADSFLCVLAAYHVTH